MFYPFWAVSALRARGIIGADTPITIAVVSGLLALVGVFVSSGVTFYQIKTSRADKRRSDEIQAKAERAEAEASGIVVAQSVMKEAILHQREEIVALRERVEWLEAEMLRRDNAHAAQLEAVHRDFTRCQAELRRLKNER